MRGNTSEELLSEPPNSKDGAATLDMLNGRSVGLGMLVHRTNNVLTFVLLVAESV